MMLLSHVVVGKSCASSMMFLSHIVVGKACVSSMILLSHFVEIALLKKVTGDRRNKNGKVPARMKNAD